LARKRAAAKSQNKPRPDAAQLKAIDRLLEEGKYREAVPRIRAALDRFPDHGGLHRALVEALEQSRGPQLAAVAAFAWAECRPNSLPAQQALMGLAISLGHLLLADRTAAKVRELGGQTPGFPLDSALTRSFLEELGAPDASLDAVVRFDIGRLHLEGQDFAGALRWLDGVDIPPARNNRALALFHLDRIDEARDAFLTNWERHPDNLFALGWAVRLRLYQGDATGALGLCTPLATSDARRPDDALAQVAVLLLLRQDQAAWDAFERARDQEWFDRHGDRTRAMVRHVGACAASRLGNDDAARRWWQAASDMGPDLALADANLDAAGDASSPSRWPGIFEYDNTLPNVWIKALREDRAGGAGMLDTLSASNAYLEALYLGGDPTLRTLVRFVIKHRVEHGDDAAARSLLTNLESMVEYEDDARRLEGIKQGIDRLDLVKRFEQNMKALLRRGRKRSKPSR